MSGTLLFEGTWALRTQSPYTPPIRALSSSPRRPNCRPRCANPAALPACASYNRPRRVGVPHPGWAMVMTAVRGVLTGIRARLGVFVGVAAGVFALDILVPPLVLSLARKPVDFFTFNPWLKRLPEYLAAPVPPLGEKLVRLWDIALFWFSADGIFGAEWGFAVTVADLARFLLMALIVAAYFALWAYLRGTGGFTTLARR